MGMLERKRPPQDVVHTTVTEDSDGAFVASGPLFELAYIRLRAEPPGAIPRAD